MSETFRTNSQTDHETTTSGILEEVFDLQRCEKASATHFVLCKGAKLRFMIHRRAGIVPLQRAVTSYGGKMGLLLRLLKTLPYSLFAWCKLGYFAQVTLNSAVASHVPAGYEWNALIGTYGDRQKVVFQCFKANEKAPCLYIKVGNKHSEPQMQAEIRFLQHEYQFKRINVPKLLSFSFRGKDCPFNIMVTEEFTGEKVPPVLTPEIYELYKELSAETKTIDNQIMVRSHGDFAPWNIRKQGDRYMLFDWEFCGWRPQGYDLIHFLTIVNMNLKHMNFSDAYDEALATAQTYEPSLAMNKEAFFREYAELMQF